MRRLVTRALVGLLVALAGIVLLDGLCALGEYAVYGALWSGGRPVGLYLRAEGPGRPQLRPGAHLRGLLYEVRVNSMGFRGPDLVEPRRPGTIRIWCLGGSTTFDIFAPDDASTWPARTGIHLATGLPGRMVEVVNAGLPGEVLAGNADDLRAWQPRVKADYVVIYPGPNDLRQIFAQGSPGELPDSLPMGVDFAVSRVAQRWLAPYRSLEAAWTGRRADDLLLGILLERVDRLADEVLVSGAHPVLVTHALHDNQSASMSERRRTLSETCLQLRQDPDGVADTFRRANGMIAALAARRGFPLADVAAAIPPRPENWGDSIHFAAAGSDLAGRVVAESILADIRLTIDFDTTHERGAWAP